MKRQRNLVQMSAVMLAWTAECSQDYPNLMQMSAVMLAWTAECSQDYPNPGDKDKTNVQALKGRQTPKRLSCLLKLLAHAFACGNLVQAERNVKRA